jgi:hypothetical protein
MKKIVALIASIFISIIPLLCAEEKLLYALDKEDIRLYIENKMETTRISSTDIKGLQIIEDKNGMKILKIALTELGKSNFSRITTENGNRALIIDTTHNDLLFSIKIKEPIISDTIYISISDPSKIDQILLYVGNISPK